jgi:acetyltransferase-like isoleucine patch superfamily enzyme
MNKIKYIIKRLLGIKEEVSLQDHFFTKDHLAEHGFDIGDFTYGKPIILHWGEPATLKMGKYCSIADNVKIFLGGNHRTDWISTYPFNALPDLFPEAKDITGHPATKGDVIIGNDVWIGHSVMILSGVTIADGAVIGAGAVISKNVGPYEIWAGNPAVFIKKRFSDDVINKLLKEQWWNKPEKQIRKSVNKLCSKP